MKSLVTGATGFLGSYLARALAERGDEVIAFARPTSDTSEISRSCSRVALGDITDLASLKRACVGVDRVFHAAAVLSLRRSQREIIERASVDGTRNVIEACERLGVARLVHVSSVAAVGSSDTSDRVLDENASPAAVSGTWANTSAKIAGERLVIEAARAGRIDAVVVNPSLIFGAGDFRKEMRNGVEKIARGEVPFFAPGGVNVVGVMDVVRGIVLAAERGRSGERYILAGENLTGRDFAARIASAAGVPAPAKPLPASLVRGLSLISRAFGLGGALSDEALGSSLQYHWYDDSKARRELGYEPREANEAIRDSIAWLKERDSREAER